MDNLINLSSLTLVEYSAAIIVLNIVLTFILSIIIAKVYTATHRGLSYSQSFIISLVMMAVLASIAMMILGNNLVRALGILGVFSLLRFRTIIKDTKDATYLFFTLAIGMAVGTNNYTIAVISTIMLSIIIFVLHKSNFGSTTKEGFLITFVTGADFDSNSYKEVFGKHLSSHQLLQIKSSVENEKEHYYTIRFKNNQNQDKFINELKMLNGVKIVDLLSSKDAAEY